MNKIKFQVTPEGKSILYSKWRYLTHFKCYLSDNSTVYSNSDYVLGYVKEIDSELYKFMDNIYLVFTLSENDFKSENNSIFIGATDVTTNTIYKSLIFIDKNNSFVKTSSESINWILDSKVRPGTNILNLGNSFKFNYNELRITNSLPKGIQSIETIKNLISYENDMYIGDNPIDF